VRDYVVTEFQQSPGYKWERLQGRSTAAEIEAEFGVDPRKVVTILQRLPFGMGERIVVWRPAR
jgi:hypothetical protein